MSERLKEHDWKSCISTKIGIVGSNPTLSVLLFLLSTVIVGCGDELKEFEETRVMMGTVVTVKVLSSDDVEAGHAIDSAFLEVGRVDSLMSRYKEESAVSQLNRTGHTGNLELVDLLRECKKWGQLTEGAFDVTVTPLFMLWDFRQGEVPDASDLEQTLELVDYRRISVTDSTASIPAGFEVDLGGVAKGYAVDQAVTRLLSLGLRHALVEAGGDIRTVGGRVGKPWRIGVRHPRREGLLRTLEVWDGAVTTSGDYEKYFIEDGVRYHHILDPSTGQPARGCISVTILAETAAEADILATGVLVLGPDRGARLVESLEDVGALIVSEGPEGLVAKEVGRFPHERGETLQD